jgi:hypothetical protein
MGQGPIWAVAPLDGWIVVEGLVVTGIKIVKSSVPEC